MKLACIFVLILSSLSCGYGSNYNKMNPRSTPRIVQLIPRSVTAGGPEFVLTVNGSNFGTGSAVYWNTVEHRASYLTGQQVTTTISASEIANPGDVEVHINDNGQDSNTVMFTVSR